MAHAVPVITSVSPTYLPANAGVGLDVFGTGFGSPTDFVTFPGGNTSTPCFFGCWSAGHVFVAVPPTWSGNITVTSGGLTSAGFPLDISYSWSGQKWFPGRLPFTWFLNNAGAPGNTFNATRDALISGYNSWQCASGVSMNFGGGTAVATTANDGVNCRYWQNSGWSPGTIAVTTWYYNTSTGEIVEADIAFNSQHFTWSTSGAAGSMDVSNIGTHEEGHSIGLLDMYGANDSQKTMYGFGSNGETQKLALADADVAGAEFMYPHGGRADFAAGTPAGWYWTLVPRNTADATLSFAPLPATLNGNATTYINVAQANIGPDCAAPYGLNNIWLDDDNVYWVSWGGVWGAATTIGLWPNNALYVRGGRHALKETMNDNNDIMEGNYGNNVFQTQYVWSPYLLTDQVPIYDYAPPQTGSFTWPNCVGYQFTGNYWGCVGVMPTTAGDDYDIRLHDDYVGSTTGFASSVAGSAAGGTFTDFVLVNGNHAGYGATRWAGVVRFSTGGGGGYADVQQSNAVNNSTLIPGSVYNSSVGSGTITMGAYDIVKVHEIYLDASAGLTYTFWLNNQSGTADLDMALYDQAGTYFGKYSYLISGQTTAGGGNEQFNYTPSASGYYAVVVWKKNANSLGLGNTYELRVGPALSNLNATVTPGGFSYPVVPRNATGASYGNAVITTTLDGNTNDTYFNWAVQHEGPNPMPGWETDIHIDEDDYPYYWFGYTLDGNGPGSYQWVNNGPNLVRGGLHSLTQVTNPAGPPEATLADNTWRGQWAWSPLVTAKNVPNVRNAPPHAHFEFFAWPNNDGFQFTRNASYAWVVGEAPQTAGDDYELYVSDSYSGTTGWNNYWGFSVYPGTLTDFVVGHYIGTPVTMYPAVYEGVFGPTSPYTIDQSDAFGRSTGGTGNFLGVTLAANRLTDVYEANLAPNTTYYFSLRRQSGTSDLAFEVFPGTSGAVYARGGGVSSSPLTSSIDVLTYTTGGSGTFYPVVVYRNDGVGSNTPAVYDLRWSSTGLVSVDGGGDLPTELSFSGMTPNPVRAGSGKMSFDLPTRTHVRLQLFDVNGRSVRSLVDETMDPGHHNAVWDGRDASGAAVGAGLYWARFEAGGRTFTRRVSVLR